MRTGRETTAFVLLAAVPFAFEEMLRGARWTAAGLSPSGAP